MCSAKSCSSMGRADSQDEAPSSVARSTADCRMEIADQPPRAAFLSPPPLAVVSHGRLIRFAWPRLPPGGRSCGSPSFCSRSRSTTGLVTARDVTRCSKAFPRGPGSRDLPVVQAGQRVIGFLDQVGHGQSVKARWSFE